MNKGKTAQMEKVRDNHVMGKMIYQRKFFFEEWQKRNSTKGTLKENKKSGKENQKTTTAATVVLVEKSPSSSTSDKLKSFKRANLNEDMKAGLGGSSIDEVQENTDEASKATKEVREERVVKAEDLQNKNEVEEVREGEQEYECVRKGLDITTHVDTAAKVQKEALTMNFQTDMNVDERCEKGKKEGKAESDKACSTVILDTTLAASSTCSTNQIETKITGSSEEVVAMSDDGKNVSGEMQKEDIIEISTSTSEEEGDDEQEQHKLEESRASIIENEEEQYRMLDQEVKDTIDLNVSHKETTPKENVVYRPEVMTPYGIGYVEDEEKSNGILKVVLSFGSAYIPSTQVTKRTVATPCGVGVVEATGVGAQGAASMRKVPLSYGTVYITEKSKLPSNQNRGKNTEEEKEEEKEKIEGDFGEEREESEEEKQQKLEEEDKEVEGESTQEESQRVPLAEDSKSENDGSKIRLEDFLSANIDGDHGPERVYKKNRFGMASTRYLRCKNVG
mmetsp:Transcript_31805/g.44509  ORF Transcript_31805/g.44509 Transcript_31805/m.44509 type:complete len:506 (+) Transcript_31805:186-1703(+)